jgi:hybrid polyketide synthase/nonribosomal peptide synthetase ACE1
MQDALLIRLRSILMLPKTEMIDPNTPLVQLGANSIMAVDIRAWFLKELDVDIPVLKILGPDETVARMVAYSVTKLSLDIDSTKNGDGKEQNTTIPESITHFQANVEVPQVHAPSSGSENTRTLEESSMGLAFITYHPGHASPVLHRACRCGTRAAARERRKRISSSKHCQLLLGTN